MTFDSEWSLRRGRFIVYKINDFIFVLNLAKDVSRHNLPHISRPPHFEQMEIGNAQNTKPPNHQRIPLAEIMKSDFELRNFLSKWVQVK